MAKAPTKQELDIEGRKVTVSNLDKVLYPESGFTKAQVIDFYIRISQYLLPHFHNRPVTLKRFPDGVTGESFYEKDAPRFKPEWVTTFSVPRRAGGTPIRYILINDLPTLVWCANVASLELHPFLHCAPAIEQPTSVVFDLDPGEGANILTCAQVAFVLRDTLAAAKLQSFAKVSGSKGLQLYVPLNSEVAYDAALPFAKALAESLAAAHPDLIVAEMAKVQRAHKVFIDWSQNSDFKTTIGVYSLRAKFGHPLVSLPVSWDELQAACDSGKRDGLVFSPEKALARVVGTGDLFAPVLTLTQTLPGGLGSLQTYTKKRNFTKTAEPAPVVTPPRASKQGSRKRFVVQKHAASHLHYDFRLEMHDVLKSWAVPKGVPLALEDRRLAMATEDHPIEYLDFEGTIPEGQYGGGTVMVWDIGTYELIDGNYYKGDLLIYLDGKKLKGEWRLTKNRSETGNKWLLRKEAKALKPLAAKKADVSALTSRTLEQIAADKTAQWHSNRTPLPGLDIDNLPKSPMSFIEPMQALIAAELPEGKDWQYEVKLDGYRALSIKQGGEVQLLSRRNHSYNTKFAPAAKALEKLEDGSILDGEIVALDDDGRPAFNVLQHYKPGNQPLVFYVFDLLAYRGRDITSLPLGQRRVLLESLLPAANEHVRLSATLDAPPEHLIAAVREQGLEGVIAKRKDSRYEAGERSGRWLKVKTNQGQELVVGGYRPSGKNRFDNLAVGYYQGKQLIFIAKLKNGFSPEAKEQIFARLEKLQSPACPFANLPEPKTARRGEALTAEAMKNYRWIKPKLVVQAEFTDWTSTNHLRHARYIGIRDDKEPRQVVHEMPRE